jgi:heptosyltransferase-3
MKRVQINLVFTAKSAIQSLKSFGFQKIMESICWVRNSLVRTLPERDVRRILIVQMANIGDAILSTPIISALSKKYNSPEINVLTGSENIVIFDNNPSITSLIIYDSKKYVRHNNKSSHAKFIKEITDGGIYDLVVLVRADVRFLLFLLLGSYKKVALYRIKHHPQRWMWLHYLGLAKQNQKEIPHNVEIIFDSLKSIGIDLEGYRDEKSIFPLTESVRFEANKVLLDEGIAGDYVVFHINTPFKYRSWPTDNFAMLINHVTKRWELRCILIGSPRDKEYCDLVLSKDTNSKMVYSLAGKVNLQVTAALIEKARAYVGNDSGPMHIAAAVGTPLLAFFGPQTPELFHPWQTRYRILSSSRRCSPCWQRYCVSPDNYCMMDISVEKAILSLDEIMKEEIA